jgi:hypothetical protein
MSRQPNQRRDANADTSPRDVRFTPNDYARTWLVRIDAERNIVAVLGSWGVDPYYKPEGAENPFVPASPDQETMVRQSYADRIKRGH